MSLRSSPLSVEISRDCDRQGMHRYTIATNAARRRRHLLLTVFLRFIFLDWELSAWTNLPTTTAYWNGADRANRKFLWLRCGPGGVAWALSE